MTQYGGRGSEAKNISQMSAFGGNYQDPVERYDKDIQGYIDLGSTPQEQERIKKTLADEGYIQGQGSKAMDPTLEAAARSVDALDAQRRRGLGRNTQGRADEMGNVRHQMVRGRERQLGLLDQMASRDSATGFQRASMLNQVQDQLAQARDPRQRLRGIGRAASPMAQQMAQAGVGEQQALEGALIGGTGALRQGDLQQVGIEQQELARQIQQRIAMEDQALRLAGEAEGRLSTMAGTELDLDAIQAQNQAQAFDWAGALIPGALQAGAGVLAMGAAHGGGAPGVIDKNAALEQSMMGMDADLGFSTDGYATAAPPVPTFDYSSLNPQDPMASLAPVSLAPPPMPMGSPAAAPWAGTMAGGIQLGSDMPSYDIFTGRTLN